MPSLPQKLQLTLPLHVPFTWDVLVPEKGMHAWLVLVMHA